MMCHGSYQEWKRFIKKEYGTENDDNNILYTIKGASLLSLQQIKGPRDFHYVMWVWDKTDVLTIVHEAIHIGFAILSDRGIKYDIKNDEAFAYYVEFIVKTFLKL